MPRVRIKLSQGQLKELMKRLLKREASGKMSREEISNIAFRRLEPPVEKEYSILRDTARSREVEGAVDTMMQSEPWISRKEALLRLPEARPDLKMGTKVLPVEEARSLLMQDPMRWSPKGIGRPVERLSFPSGAGTPDELAEGLAYERMKFRSPLPQAVQKGFKQQVERASPGVTPVKEQAQGLMQQTIKASELWADLGGLKGIPGRVWKSIYESSRFKRHYADARDYFISFYARWSQAPEKQKLAKQFPREARFMQTVEGGRSGIKDRLEEAYKGRIGAVAPLGISSAALGAGRVNLPEPSSEEVMQ